MSELERRIDSTEDALERELLASAASDGLDARRSAKVLGALGIASGAAVQLSATAAAAANQSSALAAVGSKAGIAAALSGAKLKVAAVSLSVVGAASVGTLIVQSPPDVPAPQSQPEIAATIDAELRPSEAEVVVDPPPLDKPRVKPPSARGPSKSRPKPPDLPAEIAQLEAVRSQLRSGRGAAALRSVRAYRERFPTGTLRTEALVLEIEALAKIGNQSAARRKAQAFLKRHPTSPYADRLRSVLK